MRINVLQCRQRYQYIVSSQLMIHKTYGYYVYVIDLLQIGLVTCTAKLLRFDVFTFSLSLSKYDSSSYSYFI